MRKTLMALWTSLVVAFFLNGFISFAAAQSDPPLKGDYTTYGSEDQLPFRRNGVNYMAVPLTVTIETSNPNFSTSHCSVGTTKIKHYHTQKNYGSNFGGSIGTVTLAEGKAFWDWYYQGYSNISGGATPTIVTNCVDYAYDGQNGCVAKNWVDPNDAQPYRNALHRIVASGDNGGYDTVPGDRCDAPGEHVWVIEESPTNCAATCVVWKNNSSGEYTWFPTSPTNDCPKGSGTYFETYEIYNISAR